MPPGEPLLGDWLPELGEDGEPGDELGGLPLPDGDDVGLDGEEVGFEGDGLDGDDVGLDGLDGLGMLLGLGIEGGDGIGIWTEGVAHAASSAAQAPGMRLRVLGEVDIFGLTAAG